MDVRWSPSHTSTMHTDTPPFVSCCAIHQNQPNRCHTRWLALRAKEQRLFFFKKIKNKWYTCKGANSRPPKASKMSYQYATYSSPGQYVAAPTVPTASQAMEVGRKWQNGYPKLSEISNFISIRIRSASILRDGNWMKTAKWLYEIIQFHFPVSVNLQVVNPSKHHLYTSNLKP